MNRATYLLWLLCACANEAGSENATAISGSVASVPIDAAIPDSVSDHANASANLGPDAAVDPMAECFRELLETEGKCTIPLPSERWVARLDCMALILLDGTALMCAPPDGWSIGVAQQLILHGSACEQARAEPTVPLEILIPCWALSPTLR